jgi:hypothetical protein
MLRLLCTALVAMTLAGGCSTESGPPKKACYPVKGQLLVQGKPAEGVLLSFHPKENANPAEWSMGFPHATTATDGKFEVGTYTDNDGAPTGEYILVAIWSLPNPQNEEASLPDKLGGRYADAATSKVTVKVEAKANELPPLNLQ